MCPPNHGAIGRVAVFAGPGSGGRSPIIQGLSSDNIAVEYLDAGGVVLADPVGGFGNIRYVRTRVVGFQHALLIPFVGGALTMEAPPFLATLPRESLGIPREGAQPVCFGTAN